MQRFVKIALAGIFAAQAAVCGAAEDVSREQIKGLDEQIQDIKKDVLGVSSELVQLEEKLIYPSNTQMSLFVALAQNAKFRLDSVELKVDDNEATTHIYTFQELEALQHGGVQRLYTGNVREGEHKLDVTLIGKTSSNKDYRETASYSFTKAEGPRLVEMTLAGPVSDNHNINFKDW